MSDNIPIAEELLLLQCKKKVDLISWDNAIIFAKNLTQLHVKEALKAASEKAEMKPYPYNGCSECGRDDMDIDKQSILNAYPKENIL